MPTRQNYWHVGSSAVCSYEQQGLEFQQRLRAGFLQLAEAEPQRLQVIDALGTQQEVTAKVLQVIGRVISGEK